MKHKSIGLFLPVLIASLLYWRAPVYAQTVYLKFSQLPPSEIQEDLRSFTDGDAARESQLRKIFEQAGCADADLTEEQFQRKDPPNIICTLRGSSDSTIIVGAHTDHVEAGQGVVDDWSGAALLPALLKSLHKVSRRHTFLFIGFADEEKGMWGSHYFVQHLTREQLHGIRAMVNLECLGLTPTKVWSDRADRHLLSDLILIARIRQLDLQGVNVDGVGDDDTHPFLSRHVPVITIHSVTQETWPILHSKRDTLSAINLNDYYASYYLIAAYLAYLDATLPQ
ncbi:MAG TPA: M28 family peptidase [Candidatus Angelobacter sp.]|nr:M28 family peptidase [Candidatus Angelobacter sp.]